MASGRDYRCPKYMSLRKAVLKRDGNECLQCKSEGVNSEGQLLDVHHIVPWSEDESLRLNISNCISLCRKHHIACSNGKEHLFADFYRELVEKQTKENKPKPKRVRNPHLRF